MSVNSKKYNGIRIIFIMVLITVALSGCNRSKNIFNDNSGNSINGGIAVTNGKQAVYTDGKSLFQIENDTVTEIVAIDGNIQGMINVYDRLVYFYGGLNKNDGTLKRDEGYYSYNRDTEEIKLILPYKPLALSHYQDKIFFINPIDKNTIYSCTFEGKNFTKVSDETAMNMAIDKEYIYYVSGLNLALYKIKHDGTQKEALKIEGVLSMMVHGDRIYFKDGYNEYKFTVIDKNGKNKEVITENNVFSFNVAKDNVYYSGDVDQGGIFKLKTSGDNGGGILISKDIAVHINIAGDYLFYRKMTDGRIYRSNLDGSNEILIQD